MIIFYYYSVSILQLIFWLVDRISQILLGQGNIHSFSTFFFILIFSISLSFIAWFLEGRFSTTSANLHHCRQQSRRLFQSWEFLGSKTVISWISYVSHSFPTSTSVRGADKDGERAAQLSASLILVFFYCFSRTRTKPTHDLDEILHSLSNYVCDSLQRRA